MLLLLFSGLSLENNTLMSSKTLIISDNDDVNRTFSPDQLVLLNFAAF